MALKKADNAQGVTIDTTAVQIAEETNTTAETSTTTQEILAETSVETSSKTQPYPIPETKPDESEIPVVNIPETSSIEVNPSLAPETNIPKVEPQVRIRMARDHRCNIGMKFYDLKKGQCYNVPNNVKRVLNNAGLLSPL